MSTANAERGHCAPPNGQTRIPGFNPAFASGLFNAADLTADKALSEQKPAAPALRPGVRVRLLEQPKGPARVIVGVITEETLDGAVKRLRLGWVEGTIFGPCERSLVVSPALVFALASDNDPALRAARAEAAEVLRGLAINGFAVVPAGAAVEVVQPKAPGSGRGDTASAGIEWCQSGETKKVSRCGRFTLACENHGVTARDNWTGEEVTRLSTVGAAEQWCGARLEVPAVSWSPRVGGGLVGERAGVQFEVYQSVSGWHGLDPRIPPMGLSAHLRQSPAFGSPEKAQGWCAVRAACKISGGDKGPRSLRYEDPGIPF